MQVQDSNNYLRQPLSIQGYGCISPAGMDASSLFTACDQNTELPVEQLTRSVGEKEISYPVRYVDTKTLRSHMPKHPRLRRSSNVTKFAVTAAFQAIGQERIKKIQNRELNIGVLVSFMNGCVNYSNRFYTEALEDPALASPILFPETVFNAPASHIASFLDCDGPAYTLIGDSATWLSALCIAHDWLTSEQVDGCLVVCAEEIDWLTSEGLSLYSNQLIASEGSAALYVDLKKANTILTDIYGPFDYTDQYERQDAITKAWNIYNQEDPILAHGLSGVAKIDAAEQKTIENFKGTSLQPNKIIGDAMGARCGFQTIAALEALKQGTNNSSSLVLASGGNQHAYAARFRKEAS